MRITRIRLEGFKVHRQLEIEPSAGLTIVRGPNEAGKSSLQLAIELALFRKADTNREDIRQARAWGSPAAPEVVLEFEVDGRQGSLRKRFGSGRSEGELTLDGQTIGDYQLIQDELTGLIGVPSESFYRATASVSHADLGAVAGAEAAIGDRLQKAVSGADRGTARAKKKLATAIRRYRTEGHKNPGLLKAVRIEMASLEQDLAEGEAALARLEADRAAWVEADARLAELDLQLSRQQADLAEAQRAEELAERRDAAVARWERLKRAAELLEKGARLRRELPSNVQLPQVRSSVPRLQALELEVSELEAEIATTVQAAGEGGDQVPPRPMAWLAAAAVLTMAGWAAMFLLRDAGLVGMVVVAGIGVAVAATLVQAARQAVRRRQYGLAMTLAEQAAAEHEELARSQQEQLRRKQREIAALLEALGVRDLTGAITLLDAFEKQTEVLARIDGELRGLGVDDHNARRIEEARDKAANEVELARHALAAMGGLARDPAATRVEAQRLVSQTVPEREAARSEADQARGRVDANVIDAELVASLAERLAAAKEREAELERRVGVYEGTLAAIEAAEQATLKTAARYLEDRMGPTISTITDGRYDDIEVDETNLAFRVRAPETGELVEAERLSQGTADQLFLAARLGLVRLVTLDRRPPLILDDPFVTFDAARAERALRLIKRLSHEHGFQVFYLTCSDRFDVLADELVVLPGPSGARVPATPPAGEAAPDPTNGPRPRLAHGPGEHAVPDPSAPRPDQAGSADDGLAPLAEEAPGAPDDEAPASSRSAAVRAARTRRDPEPAEAAEDVGASG